MSAQPKIRWTPEQYLAMERKAETKSEYYAGEVYALAGASRIVLRNALRILGVTS